MSAWYSNGAKVEYTGCRIITDFTQDGYSKIKLEINAGKSRTDYTRMTSTMFREFFGGESAKDTKALIESYKGTQPGRSHMSIEFNSIEDAKKFVDEIIAPKVLMGKLGSTANG